MDIPVGRSETYDMLPTSLRKMVVKRLEVLARGDVGEAKRLQELMTSFGIKVMVIDRELKASDPKHQTKETVINEDEFFEIIKCHDRPVPTWEKLKFRASRVRVVVIWGDQMRDFNYDGSNLRKIGASNLDEFKNWLRSKGVQETKITRMTEIETVICTL